MGRPAVVLPRASVLLGRLSVLALVLVTAGCGTNPPDAVAAEPPASSAGSVAPSTSAAPPSRAPAPASSAPAGRPASPATTTAARRPKPKPEAAAKRWVPAPGSTWQWQLSGPVDMSVDVDIYDIDGFNATRAIVAELHERGRKVVCYIEAGGAEDYRPDHAAWPEEVLGKGNGWPGERWLDVRDVAKLEPVLAKRFDMCRDKGFDAVEADLVDGYAQDTGFPITARHQLVFNRALARMAHERGLSIALKNDLAQIPELVGDFDFAVNESCFVYDECHRLSPFVRAGKAVLHAEYESDPADYCPVSKRLGLSSLHKKPELGVYRRACPD